MSELIQYVIFYVCTDLNITFETINLHQTTTDINVNFHSTARSSILRTSPLSSKKPRNVVSASPPSSTRSRSTRCCRMLSRCLSVTVLSCTQRTQMVSSSSLPRHRTRAHTDTQRTQQSRNGIGRHDTHLQGLIVHRNAYRRAHLVLPPVSFACRRGGVRVGVVPGQHHIETG